MVDASWAGTLALDAGWAMFVGRVGETDEHAHHAIQIGLSTGAPLAWRLAGERSLRGRALAVGSDVAHRVVAAAPLGAHLYVDPDTEEGRRLASAVGDGRVGPDARTGPACQALAALAALAAAGGDVGWDQIDAVRRAIADVFAEQPSGHPRPLDARIGGALAQLRREGGRATPAAELAELAEAAGLSPGRLSHLFRQETGVSIRTYRLWLRLRAAVETLHERRSLTDAAARAGFSDSAHLSRTFRRMFGMPPSEAMGRLRIVLPPGPDR